MMNFLKNHWGSLLGLTILGLLVWYAGDITKYLFDYPSVLLDSRAFRVLLIVLLVMLWLTIQLVTQLRAKKREEGLHNELTEETLRAQEDVGHNRERFLKVLEKLKATSQHRSAWESFLKPNLYLYDEKPWYIIIGPSRTGKTTILKNSGLHFNFQDEFEQEISGSGSTLYCDWWFSDEAVLLDTAGRYFTQKDQQAVDSTGWLGLVDLLKKYRPRRPVNGVIIAFDLSRLLDQAESQLDELIRFTKHRLLELEQRLQVTLPVYCVFTKCDLVAGFQESFYHLTPQALEQVWGITFSDKDEKNTKNVVSLFGNKFDQLINRLHEQLLERLHQETREDNSHHQPRARMYNFPQQMALLKAPLNSFLTEIFRARSYGKEQPVRLRGVYFTSATQEGSPIDLLIKRLGDDFQLPPQLIDTEAGQGRSYFVKKLFTAVMFKERNLVGLHRRLEIRNQAIYWGTTGLAVLIVGVLGWHWWNSYGNNQVEIGKLDQAAKNDSLLVYKRTEGNSEREVMIPEKPDFKGILPALNALREAVEKGYAGCKQDQPKKENCTLYPYQGPSVPETPESIPVPWNLQWGLYQGEELQEKARLAYYRMLDKVFLRHIAVALRNQLSETFQLVHSQEGGNALTQLYSPLRLYLALRQANISNLLPKQNAPGQRNLAAELQDEMKAIWKLEMSHSLLTEDDQNELTKHLNTLLERLALEEKQQLTPEQRVITGIDPTAEKLYDADRGETEEQLVIQIRATWQTLDAKMLYRDLETSKDVRNLPKFTLVNKVGTSIRGVFTGDSLDEEKGGVPGFYTKPVFCNRFDSLSNETIKNYGTEEWVLGPGDFMKDLNNPEQLGILKVAMKSKYLDEYYSRWQNLLNAHNLKIVAANNMPIADLIDRIKITNSPLELLLEKVVENTQLDCTSNLEDSTVKDTKGTPSAKQGATVARRMSNLTGSSTLSKAGQVLDLVGQVQDKTKTTSGSGTTSIAENADVQASNPVTQNFQELNRFVASNKLQSVRELLNSLYNLVLLKKSLTEEERKEFDSLQENLNVKIKDFPEPVKSWMQDIIGRSEEVIEGVIQKQTAKEAKEQQAKKDQEAKERLVAEQEQLRVKEEQKNNLRTDQAKDRQTLVAEQQQAVKELQIGQTKEREKLRTDQDRDREKWRVDHEQDKEKLNAKWKTQVYEVYERVLKDGYPLSSGKKKDIKLDDFASFFKPGNTMENLVNEANDFLVQQRQSGESLLTEQQQSQDRLQQQQREAVKSLLEKQTAERKTRLERQQEARTALDSNWQEPAAGFPTLTAPSSEAVQKVENANTGTMNSSATLSVEVTSAMENAKNIGQAFFPDGQLSMGFRLKPYDADPAVVDTVTLDFYGESWRYEVGTPKLSKNFQWPKPEGTDQVRLKLKFKDGREETVCKTCNGDWAWFKFLDEAKLEKHEDNFRLHITVVGSTVTYDLEAMRGLNPFTEEVKQALHDFRVSPDLF